MNNYLSADWPAPENIVAGTTFRGSTPAVIPARGVPCWLNQVHGAAVVTAGRFETPPAADASIGRTAECLCVVRTADCLPVLLCSADGSEFAAVHAGWRGLAAGVIENTVGHFDAAPKELMAWFGPAISQPAFEVGDEVRAAFVSRDAGAARCFKANDNGRWQADLYRLARQRLTSVGVGTPSGGGFCTFQDEKRFYSYRRNPHCGRMLSFIGRKTA